MISAASATVRRLQYHRRRRTALLVVGARVDDSERYAQRYWENGERSGARVRSMVRSM
eukprot:COSAG01_NODE_40612_length_461_cov_1.842541_2_plen_58_part_00